MKKNVYSENEKGDPIEVIGTYSDMEEAFLVANKVSQTQLMAHDSLDEYAILYRTNAQSRQLEESLRKRNIPYRIYGGLSFYQRKEVKDAICYFRLSVNPDDEEALRRVINFPARGIGETTMKKISHAAIETEKSLWQVIQDPVASGVQINSGTLKKLDSFRSLIQEFYDKNAEGMDASHLGSLIFTRIGLITMLAHDKTPESISKKENLEEILSGLKDFVDSKLEEGDENVGMADFLSEISLATDQDKADDKDEPKITLMTAHAAKGLEFSHVFIVGVEEELFPSSMSMDSLAEVEEERRLLYVAITRAKKTCVMTFAKSRFRNGQTIMTRPSRFLSDIDRRFLRLESSTDIGKTSATFTNPIANYQSSQRREGSFRSGSSSGYRQTKPQAATGSGSIHRVEELATGMHINHTRFGHGIIMLISEISGEPMIMAKFDQVGEKKLLLKFARFTIDS